MIICPICNYENRINAKFCRICGGKLYSAFICPGCNKNNPSSEKYCSCGVKLQTTRSRSFITNLLDSSEDRESNSNELEIIDTFNLVKILKEIFNTDMETIKNIISYQNYIFEKSEKGLAIIEEVTERFVTVNTQFEKITGCTRDILTGETLTSLLARLNSRNKPYDISLLNNKFWITNSEGKRFLARLTKDNNLLKNNLLLFAMEDIESNLKKKKAMKKARSATKNLYLITKIAEDINRSLDIAVILNNTLDKIMAAISTDVALIMFISNDKTLIPIASRGISEKLLEDLKEHTLKSDTGSSARALSLGKTVDAKGVKFFSSNKRLSYEKVKSKTLSGTLALKENLLSMLIVPLKYRNEVIGIISLGSRKKDSFTEKDQDLLDSIANHIAIAIRNSRLYTQTKEQLKELEEKNKRLRELEQMKEKLTRMIVHDLKSPLASIMAYADYVKSQKGISRSKLMNFFNAIHSSTQDTLRMVLNLLDISKMENEIFNIGLSQVSLVEIKWITKHIQIIKSIPEKLPDITGDKNILYRVITNIMDNAIKYSNPEDKIKIEITSAEDKVKFCIADKGKGIPDEYREKIFESFFTIETGNEVITTSSGIGLSFCKLAIEAHGGKIWVEENIPSGSKFYFNLKIK
ncbi:MAG: Adaptive-response sensory-kinase SasA [bacterium ADurb.Bin363]|nr:MAG: Adaptive-response sensory-kinase SasA [bacterium ADurb.Bin363]